METMQMVHKWWFCWWWLW